MGLAKRNNFRVEVTSHWKRSCPRYRHTEVYRTISGTKEGRAAFTAINSYRFYQQ